MYGRLFLGTSDITGGGTPYRECLGWGGPPHPGQNNNKAKRRGHEWYRNYFLFGDCDTHTQPSTFQTVTKPKTHDTENVTADEWA